MFLNNEISPPSSLCARCHGWWTYREAKQSNQKIETYIDFLRLVLLTTRFTDCFTKLYSNGVSLFFSLFAISLKKSCGNATFKSTSFGKEMCFTTTESFSICIQACKSSSDLEALIWFSTTLEYLINVPSLTKSKWVIPFTCWAFKLITSTTSNCPSLQDIWKVGLIGAVRLLDTLEYYFEVRVQSVTLGCEAKRWHLTRQINCMATINDLKVVLAYQMLMSFAIELLRKWQLQFTHHLNGKLFRT